MKLTIKGEAFCGTTEAARLLDRSVYTVRKWCRQGRFEGIRKVGRDFVIPEKSISKLRARIGAREDLKEVVTL